jgi:TRAP-type C4-dicarboxylate transport system permease small subunit
MLLGKLNKFSDTVNTVYTYVGVIFLTYSIFAIGTQVVARYVFNHSLSWTEETARYAFIWVVLMGATVAVKVKTSAVVDILVGLLPPKAKVVHSFIIRLLMLFCVVVMLTQGVKLVLITAGQLSTAVLIPMNLVFACVPFAGFAMLVHLTVDLLNSVKDLRLKKAEGR